MDETVFTYAAPPLKFGRGAVDEIGYDVAQLASGALRRVLVVTDAGVAATGAPQRVAESIASRLAVSPGSDVVIYDDVHVEPTDVSVRLAVDFARERGPWDVVVAVGGGSSIDTAKAIALLISCPGDLLDYVNPPIGAGRAPQGLLTPLVAVPTTTGTGSESTTVCVLDVLSQHVKTGISHVRLRPVLAVVDPSLTESQPPEVTACSGLDVLCHALESYTARPYTAFERKRVEHRVPYCGSNPVADTWAERALQLMGRSFRTAVATARPEPARTTSSSVGTCRHATTSRWPQPLPGSGSETPVYMCRTPTVTRSPDGSRNTIPRGTRARWRWCRTACRSR